MCEVAELKYNFPRLIEENWEKSDFCSIRIDNQLYEQREDVKSLRGIEKKRGKEPAIIEIQNLTWVYKMSCGPWITMKLTTPMKYMTNVIPSKR